MFGVALQPQYGSRILLDETEVKEIASNVDLIRSIFEGKAVEHCVEEHGKKNDKKIQTCLPSLCRRVHVWRMFLFGGYTDGVCPLPDVGRQ